MDIDYYESNERDDIEIIFYLQNEDILDLLIRKPIYGKEGVVSYELDPDLSRNDSYDVGYYDDVLDALEEAFLMIEWFEEHNYERMPFETNKLKNTYRHYKSVQDEYR